MPRPAVFGPDRPKALISKVVNLLKTHGLQGTQDLLATEGVQQKPGKPKEPLVVSLPVLKNLAEKEGVTFKRGRRIAA